MVEILGATKKHKRRWPTKKLSTKRRARILIQHKRAKRAKIEAMRALQNDHDYCLKDEMCLTYDKKIEIVGTTKMVLQELIEINKEENEEQMEENQKQKEEDQEQKEKNKEEKEQSEEEVVTFENEVSEEEELITERGVVEPKEHSCMLKSLNIVDMQHVFNELRRIGDHSKTREDCGVRYLKFTNVIRRGLKTTFWVECTMCHHRDEFNSEPAEIDKMDLNESAVAGTLCTGGGYAQLEEFLAAMGVYCMSGKTFNRHHDKIVKCLIDAAENEMITAAEEEKLLAIKRGDILPISGLPHIPVVADGSWMKRSYRTGQFNSISGIGVIVGYHTKKVLFTGARNKSCSTCRYAHSRNQTPETHVCFKNWGSNWPSTAMESDAILEGFMTSIEKRGLVYSTLIADGDSSSYKKILDADPYEIPVKKIECTNHLLRNFCRKLREIAKKAPRGPLRRAVEYSVLRIRADIVKASTFRYAQSGTITEKMKRLYADLQNIPNHTFGDHTKCVRLRCFCDGTSRKNEKNIASELMEKGVLQRIQEIMRPLLVHVESLLYNRNNNMVEGFNSIIAKYIGGKRINYGLKGSYTARCAMAVIQYNTKQALSRLYGSMNKKPSDVLKNMENRRKRNNQLNVERLRTKRSNRARKQFRSDDDPHYGPNAEKPAMPENIFEMVVEEDENAVLSQNKIMCEIDVPVQTTTASVYSGLFRQYFCLAEASEQNFVSIMQCNADSETFERPSPP